MCFLWFHRLLESVHFEAYPGSPRCGIGRPRLRIRRGRLYPSDSIIFLRSWRYSSSTCRWQPFSRNFLRGEHLRPAITAVVEVKYLSLWPTTWIFFGCTKCSFRTACHVEWRLLITMQRAWKCLLWRGLTIAMRQLILIGVFRKSSVFAKGSSFTTIRGSWNVITAL